MEEEVIFRKNAYFKYCGEINTDMTLKLAKERCLDLGISKIIVASETGRSALKALEVFKNVDIQLIVVTHPPATTWGPKGDIPIGLYREEYSDIRRKLIESGVSLIQGTRPFAPPSRYLDWKYPTPESVIDKTLEIFGAGAKIAVEASLMATDAGAVGEGEVVVSCAGTYKGLDTALVVKTSYTMNFFKSFEVKEIVAKPLCRVKRYPEFESENWKGDLDWYYSYRF